jgi:hypothetical protein
MPEPKTITVDAARFARGFDALLQEASGVDVIEIRRRGEIVGGFLTAAELEHYRRLRRREREVLVVGELSEDVVADIVAAEYGISLR